MICVILLIKETSLLCFCFYILVNQLDVLVFDGRTKQAAWRCCIFSVTCRSSFEPVPAPFHPVIWCCKSEKCKSNFNTFFLWLMKLQKLFPLKPLLLHFHSQTCHCKKKKNKSLLMTMYWREELETCFERNLSKYHASLHLHDWDSVRVSHDSSEWERLLVDIPPIEKVERLVAFNGPRKAPHPCWLSHSLLLDW